MTSGLRSAGLATICAEAARDYPDVRLFADDGWPEPSGAITDFASFNRAVEQLAGRLWAAGVRPRSTVAVLLRNHPRIQLLAFAISRIGAIPALLSSTMSSEHLEKTIADLHPGWTVLDIATAAKLTPAVEERIRRQSRGLLLDATAGDGTDTAFEQLPAAAEHPVHQLTLGEVALITHTSGTTNPPKLVAHSNQSIYEHVAPQIELMTSFGNAKTALKSLSMVHARASSAFITSLRVGMPLGLITDDSPNAAADFIAANRPDSLEAHPNTYVSWEQIADRADRPLSTISRFSSTFDAIHPRTVRTILAGSDVKEAFFFQAYGQTESGPLCGRAMTADDPLGHDTRVVGSAVGGRAIRVADEHGAPVPTGQIGFIECMSASQMLGYVARENPPTRDGWWPMGDVGRIRADGQLELLDREVDRVAGLESTLMLEDALLENFHGLAETVVLAPMDSATRCTVITVAKAEHTVDLDAIEKFLVGRGISPVQILPMQQSELPLTGSKKVRRAALADQIKAGR